MLKLGGLVLGWIGPRDARRRADRGQSAVEESCQVRQFGKQRVELRSRRRRRRVGGKTKQAMRSSPRLDLMQKGPLPKWQIEWIPW